MSVTKESQSSSILMWVLSIFFGFLPSLIFMIVKKDDAFTHNNAKEALNICITLILAYIVIMVLGTILMKVLAVLGLVVMLLSLVIGLYALFCFIMGAVKASKGESFRAPFALRLIK